MVGHTVASRMKQSLSCSKSARILSTFGPSLDSLLQTSARHGGRDQEIGTLQSTTVAAVNYSGEASSYGPTPLATQGPYNTQVKSCGVVRLDGPDVFKYLQGLVTNDVSRLEREPPDTKEFVKCQDSFVLRNGHKSQREMTHVEMITFGCQLQAPPYATYRVVSKDGDMGHLLRLEPRSGGYTRFLATRIRQGDATPLAYIEFVDCPNEIREAKSTFPPPPQLTPLAPWLHSKYSWILIPKFAAVALAVNPSESN